MIKHFEHIGMATADMDACLGFYVGLLGCELALRKPSPGGAGEVAFVSIGGGMLEIVSRPNMKRPAYDVPRDQVGMRHMTFNVDDVDTSYARLIAAGVASSQAPRDAQNIEIFSRVAFVKDPDGVIVELVSRQPGFTAGRS
jgi:glyoxylase I family protein